MPDLTKMSVEELVCEASACQQIELLTKIPIAGVDRAKAFADARAAYAAIIAELTRRCEVPAGHVKLDDGRVVKVPVDAGGSEFVKHLECASSVVRSWPRWKQELLGGKAESKEWPTSAETSAIAWPIDVMSGAEWNILDATGTRIAVCGYDCADKTHPTPNAQDCYGSGRQIGNALVGMIRNLQAKNETLQAALAAQAKGVEG